MNFEDVLPALRAGKKVRYAHPNFQDCVMWIDFKYDLMRYDGDGWYLIKDDLTCLIGNYWEICE